MSVLCADLLSLTIYRTDAGSLDKNGVAQPAFLNFDAKLRHPPAHEMQVSYRHFPLLSFLAGSCSCLQSCGEVQGAGFPGPGLQCYRGPLGNSSPER